MDYMSLLLSLGDFLVFDDNGVDDDELVMWIMSMGEPSFYTIHMIKDRGNSLFKDGKLSLAGSLYKLALEFFCFIAIPPTQEQPAATSLVLSLILNLAACELKLFHFNEARCFCNVVLNFDPFNVKALYRRGCALKKLNLLVEAKNDLEHALKLDPKNKDVSRELSSVTECLLLNSNGKRVACPFDPLGRDRKGKKPLLDVVMDNKIGPIDVVSGASCCTMELLGNEISCVKKDGCQSSDMFTDSIIITEPYPPTTLGCDSKPSVSKPSVSLVPETTKFSFTNKKHSHKNLYLSAKDYETLMLGKNLQFFHPISGASMSVRPLITKSFTLTGTPHEDLSREAAVPSFSPLPMNHFTTSDIGPSSTLNNSDDEDADHHEVKRSRLSAERSFDQISEVGDISMIEAAILDQPGNTNSIPVPSQSMFVFSAMKTHSRRACNRFEAKTSSRHCSTLVRAKVKGKSLLTVRDSSVFCRFGTVEKVVSFKRKEEDAIHFDSRFHPPFKKRRLCVRVNSVCNSSYVSCVSSSLGVFSGPRFVL